MPRPPGVDYPSGPMLTFWRTLISLWTWLFFGVVVILFTPLITIAWLVTAPFDPGRYLPGLLFRKVAVVMAWGNPIWHFHRSGYR
ncbi:MAG: hypothetical protein ACREL6_05680, partial [Gemmatimonadales bacterium]